MREKGFLKNITLQSVKQSAGKIFAFLLIQAIIFTTIAPPAAVANIATISNFANSPARLPGNASFGGAAVDPLRHLRTTSPALNIPDIEGLNSNPHGSAQFSLPLTLPLGRNGLTPGLSIDYASESGNGWLGVDFSVYIPSITIDTTFGVPDYDGRDQYVLNGSKLVEAGSSGNKTIYRKRVEDGFQRIERYGSAPSNYHFVVTEKNGLKNIYGTADAILQSYRAINGALPIYTWHLKQTIDTNGNTVIYHYTEDSNPGPGEDWRAKYLSRIQYTGHTSGETGNYEIEFVNDTQARQDIISDARGRFQTKIRHRLKEIVVKYKGDAIRKYKLDYIYGDFGKSKISAVHELDGAGNEFYAYNFDYHTMPRINDGFDAFQPTARWDQGHIIPEDVLAGNLDTTQTLGGGGGIELGYGPSGSSQNSTVGAGIDVQVDLSKGIGSLMDINGDGLQDQVYQILAGSSLGYRLNTGHGFSNFGLLNSEIVWAMSSDLQLDLGFSAYVGVGPARLSIGGNASFANGISMLNDINGDGYIDFVPFPFSPFFQKGSGLNGFDTTPWTSSGSGELTLDLGIDEMEGMEDVKEAYHMADPVRKWKPYHKGTIVITGEIQKLDDGEGISDGVELNLYKNSGNIWPGGPVILKEGAQTQYTHEDEITVTREDGIYFRAGSMDTIENDTVNWDAEITYTNIHFLDDMGDYHALNQPYPYHGNAWPVGVDVNRYYIEIANPSGPGSFRVYSDTEYEVFQTPYLPGIEEAVVVHIDYENPENLEKTSYIEIEDYDATGSVATYKQYLHVFNAAKDFSLIDTQETVETDEVFAGGVYNWLYGEWNGNLDWNHERIGEEPDEDDQTIIFAPMTPMDETTEENQLGIAMWKGTEIAYTDQVLGNNGEITEEEKYFVSYISNAEIMPSKKGGDAMEKVPSSQQTLSLGGINLLQNSLNFGVFGNLGIPPLSSTLNLTWSNTYSELMDMNGDQYLDQLISTLGIGDITVILNENGEGYNRSIDFENGYGDLRESVTQVFGLGLAKAFKVKQSSSGKVKSVGAKKAKYNITPSVSGSLGENITKVDLMDMNGDGLPDHVKRDEKGKYTVKLNLGDGFSVEEEYTTLGFDETPIQTNLIDKLSSITGEISGFPENGGDSVRYTNTVSAGFNLSVGTDKASVSGGLNLSGSRTKVDLVDMNGDGLVDQVFKLNKNGYFLVRLNYGDRFGDLSKWHTPAWEIGGDGFNISDYRQSAIASIVNTLFGELGVDEINPGDLTIDISEVEALLGEDLAEDVSILGAGDVVNWNGTIGISITIGADIEAPIPLTGTSIYIAPSGNFGVSRSASQLQMSDIDGDNLPDHIFKYELDNFYRVKVNKAKKVGLLKTIYTPIGGTVSLDYERTKHSIDAPQSQYVLSEIVKNDGKGNDYKVDYDYFDSAFYDREERASYGFNRVRETFADGTYVESYFHNRDFYKMSLPYLVETHDGSGLLMSKDEYEYDKIPLAARSYFPALKQSTSSFYDLTDPQRTRKMTQEVNYEYNSYGNVIRTIDKGDLAKPEDDKNILTEYYIDTARHIVSQPSSVTIKDLSGTIHRNQQNAYDTKGNLVQIKNYLSAGADPISFFEYDHYGNLIKETDPKGFWTETQYDQENHIYPTSTNNTFGYSTNAEYDYKLGAPTSSTDSNGNVSRQQYDTFGRIIKIWSPYDAFPSGVPALEFQYFHNQYPLRALIRNKLHIDPENPETIDAALVIDGLGRDLQTRTEAEVDVNGTAQHGTILSGTSEYDEMGRVKRQGQVEFIPGYDLSYLPLAIKNPITYNHDDLGRVTQTTLADGAVTTQSYTINQGFFKTQATDPNGKQSAGYRRISGHIERIEQHNQGSAILTNYDYTTMDELNEITDNMANKTTVAYDTLGRITNIDNPDRGLQEFAYDPGGNVTQRRDANLAAKAKSIKYIYDYNRLKRIDYPESHDVELHYGAPGALENRVSRLTRIVDESGVMEFYYGNIGETTKLLKTMNFLNPGQAPMTFVSECLNDYMGRVEWKKFPDSEEVFYEYDKGGSLAKVHGTHKGARFDYIKQTHYNKWGKPVSIIYGNDVETQYSYDPVRLWTSALNTAGPVGNIYQNITYTRDLTGNILTLRNQTETDVRQDFAYDDLYQLVSAKGIYQQEKPKFSSRYDQAMEYDTTGNIVRKTSSVVENPGNRDIAELTYDMTYQMHSLHPHQAQYIGDRHYKYDGNGNVKEVYLVKTSGKGSLDIEETYLWDEENRLRQVKFEGRSVDFLYDASGRRTVKRGQQGEFLYVDGAFELQNRTEVTKHIFVGNTRAVSKISKYQDNASLSFEQDNVYYYHMDHIGNTNFVTRPDGTSWDHAEYTPYGETWVDEVTNANKIEWKFSSKEQDESTGFYYFGARYYHQKISRWLSADPAFIEYLISGEFSQTDLSMYSYASNNPVMFTDLDGRIPDPKSNGIENRDFNSVEEAIDALHQQYRDRSRDEDTEFGAYVYQHVVEEEPPSSGVWSRTKNLFKRKRTRVSYRVSHPEMGDEASVTVNLPRPERQNRPLAHYHSHAGYSLTHDNENFSGADISVYDKYSATGYLTTPKGALKRRDPHTKEETTIIEGDRNTIQAVGASFGRNLRKFVGGAQGTSSK